MFKKIEQVKNWVIEQILWAEKELDGKSGAEKKAAVVKKLDAMIVFPAYLEWLDDIIIGKLVDMACEKLNSVAGHDFAKKQLSEEQEKEVKDAIEVEVKENGDNSN